MENAPPGVRVHDGRADQDDAASDYLARATWILVAALATMAVSIWVLQATRMVRTPWVLHSAAVSRVALRAQTGVTDREAAVRADLTAKTRQTQPPDAQPKPTLAADIDSLVALTSDDAAQHTRAVAIAHAVGVWDTTFVAPVLASRDRGAPHLAEPALLEGLARSDSVRAALAALMAAETAQYRERLAGQQRPQRIMGLALLISFVVMLIMLAYLRRRLGQQIARATAQRKLIESQNEGLRAQRDALEFQTAQLQEQAEVMETQAAELQEHTAELELAVRRLDESERRLAEAQQIAQIGTWEVDPKTRDVFWSLEMFRLLDTTPGEYIPSFDSFMERVHFDDRTLVREKMGKAMRGEGDFVEEIRVHRPGGDVRRLLTRGALVTWDGDSRRKVVGTAQDITERKRAEKELRDAEDRLRQSQKMEAVGQLAGGVAHDFNNLLTVILSYSTMLLASEDKADEDAEPLNEIKGAAERAAGLTRQLLAFSRQQILQPRVLDLNETVRDVDKMLRRLISENIEVRAVLPERIGFVKADPGQIEQVLINLAVNARDAMKEGGTLTIETADVELDGSYAYRGAIAKPGFYVMLAVTDTGSGIPPEIRDRIFEPFYTTKAQGQGTGLGLSTVHGIVEQSGGHIWVYSEMGIGTTFKIYLPRVDTDHPDLRQRAAVPAVRRGSETILLVEDEAAVRGVARRVLVRAGYTVIEAVNGAAAIRECDDAARHIDLILTDMVMPGISGADLVNELRSRRPKARVLLMSGYTRDSVTRADAVHAESSFIEKPFTPDALLRTVRELLDRADEHG